MRHSLRSLLLLAALALLALVVRDYLGSRTAAGRDSAQAVPTLPEDLSAQSESWRLTQTIGDSTRMEVSADDFVQGADGLTTDLSGVVLEIFRLQAGSLDRVESDAMRMLADGSLYSDGETLITLGISADGGTGRPVEVATSGVTFHPSANSANTERRVDYRFSDGAGSSLGAAYDATTGVLRMMSEVRLERFGPNPDEPSAVIRAGSLLYTEDGARIELAGHARIEQGTGWLECDSGEVLISSRRIRRIEGVNARGGESVADRRTTFSASRLEAEFATSGELARSRGSGTARFASIEAGQRIEVKADSVDLHYEAEVESSSSASSSRLRRVEARGAAQASLHPSGDGTVSTIESESMLLVLRPGGEQIERVETPGRGTLHQFGRGADAPARTLVAGSIRMAYGPAGTLERLAARSGAQLVQRPADQAAPELRSWSDSLDALFDPETAEIAELRQAGNFGFEEGPRRGSADSARFELDGGVLELEGNANVASTGGDLSARQIVLARASGRIDAAGDVTGFLIQEPDAAGQSGAMGMFAGQQPVFLAAGAMVSDPESQTLEYQNGARLWQGRNRVDADSILIDQASNSITARDAVEAAWVADGGNASDPDSLSIVRSGLMRYDAQTGLARFEGAVDFRRQGMRVLAGELQTALGADGGKAGMRAVAVGSVRIADPPDGTGHRAFGDRAEFDAAESEVALVGQPARILMPDGTESEGASLTYRIAGDRLLVLGQGEERAYTYRPASR
ncbi:MAG: hypothetical protein F4X12_03350 [Acidobacteriia bacterium]|nr:hypothetical protein [Terriglobia bacterium]